MIVDLLNLFYLALVLVGLPRAVSGQMLGLHMGSSSRHHQVVLGGLAVGLIANAAGALFVARKKPTRRRLMKWSAAFTLLLVLVGLEASGAIGFGWLRRFLRWLANLSI